MGGADEWYNNQPGEGTEGGGGGVSLVHHLSLKTNLSTLLGPKGPAPAVAVPALLHLFPVLCSVSPALSRLTHLIKLHLTHFVSFAFVLLAWYLL